MLWKRLSDDLLIDICEESDYSIFGSSSSLNSSNRILDKSSDLSDYYRTKGNELVENRNWFAAIEFFNEALCFAEMESAEMACSYADRAFCYFQMKKYDECLIDIHLAKANNCPELFLPKLSKMMAQIDQRKQQPCKGEPSIQKFMPKLSFEASKEYPCAADAIQFRKQNSHRSAEAARNINIGQTILMEDGFVSTTVERYKRCCICLKSADNLVPCGDCCNSLFCRGSCEGSKLHSVECNTNLSSRHFEEDELDYHLVIRSVLMAFQIFPSVDELDRYVDRVLFNEKFEIDDMDLSIKSKYAIFLKNGMKILDWADEDDEKFIDQVTRIHRTFMDNDDFGDKLFLIEHQRFLMHLIGHHMCALRYSNLCVGAGENDGTLIHPIAGGFFRHSCHPNVALVTSDKSIIAVAIRPIQTGQELTVSYLSDDSLGYPTFLRQLMIREKFNFHCKCGRCKDTPMGVDTDVDSLDQPLNEAFKNESNFKCKNKKMRKRLEKTATKNLENNSMWSGTIYKAMITYVRLIRKKYYLKLNH